jgi:hypothetical protein
MAFGNGIRLADKIGSTSGGEESLSAWGGGRMRAIHWIKLGVVAVGVLCWLWIAVQVSRFVF